MELKYKFKLSAIQRNVNRFSLVGKNPVLHRFTLCMTLCGVVRFLHELHPRTSNTFFFVLQHTEPGSGAIFLLSGVVYSNGSAVSLLS